MNKKYKIREDGRIVALRDFGNVRKGDVGGFIEGEHNLSHEGNCWIYDNAQVSGYVRVFENAQVSGNARVFGYVRVFENAQVSGNAKVFGYVRVFGYAKVSGNARVFGDVQVSGNAQVFGDARVCFNMKVDGKRPYYFIQASRHSITATQKAIAIGCEIHAPQHWLNHYKEIGKKHGYTDAQIAEYGAILSLFKEWK